MALQYMTTIDVDMGIQVDKSYFWKLVFSNLKTRIKRRELGKI